VAYSGSGLVVIYQNAGNNNWKAISLGSVPDATSLYGADLNSDGYLDLVVASTNGSVSWFKGPSWTMYPIGSATTPRSVFAADINGDEKIDVVVGGGEIKWFLNNINSMATNSWTSVEVSYTSSGIVDSIFVVDIELNGYQDIVLVSSSANEVVWLNNTDGTGGSFDNHTIAQPSGPLQVFCEDINGDSYVDIVTVNANSTTIYYNNISSTLALDSTGSVSASTVSKQWAGFYVAQGQNKPQSVFVTSINGVASVKDIVVAVTGSNYVAWYNTTSASATNWNIHFIGNITAPTYVIAGDLNSNGVNDIIVASKNATRNYVAWFEEQCTTVLTPVPHSTSHAVGWGTATGVIGGLLLLWILIGVIVGIYDYFRYKHNKKMAKRKNRRGEQMEAMMPPELDPEL
jgi:hypothetical protein